MFPSPWVLRIQWMSRRELQVFQTQWSRAIRETYKIPKWSVANAGFQELASFSYYLQILRFKQPRKQSWLNFVFLSSKYFWFFLDWCSDVFVPSVFINETAFFFFSVYKQKSTWFEIKWLEHFWLFILSMFLIQSFIEEAFNQWISLIL